MIISAQQRQKEFERNIQGESFLSKKMKCEYQSHKAVDSSSFYSLNDCALMLNGENLSLAGKPTEEDMESILSFCEFLGVHYLETELDNLHMSKRPLLLMRYDGGKCESCPDIITNENIYGFSDFCCKNFDDAPFNTIYPYIARKVNKGISDIYYLTEGRKIVSGAVATRYGISETYVTFVSTDPEHRHKGLAAKVVRHVISQNPGRRVILMCEEKMRNFYTKLGFVEMDNIWLYTLREESF